MDEKYPIFVDLSDGTGDGGNQIFDSLDIRSYVRSCNARVLKDVEMNDEYGDFATPVIFLNQ